MRRTVFFFCAIFLVTGCPKEEPNNTDDERIIQTLFIEFDQTLVVPSSILSFRMKGSDRMVAKAAEVTFQGNVEHQHIVLATDGFPRVDGDQGDILVQVPVEEGFWDAASASGFQGDVLVALTDELGVLAEGGFENAELTFESNVPPTVSTVADGSYYLNEEIEVTGNNFLRPEEGTTWATVNGTYTHEDDTTREINGKRLAIRWTGSRSIAAFPIDPAAFGVQLGNFSGSLTFENELRTGETFDGNEQPAFSLDLQQTFLANFAETAGSRGQKIELLGRGFVPQNEEAQYGMLLRFEGEFTYDDGTEPLQLTGENALERPPDAVLSDERALISVYYEIIDGRLFGLGANPGTFTGVVVPILFDEFGEQIGVEWEGEFRVLPTKQMVYIKYLPGFSKGLEKYGLSNVEFEIRNRILEVTNRDYSDVNVEFVDTPPTNFIDFATIEIGGPDPTGGNKFGYDNTCNVAEEKCKDTDNLFLADYLGGVNSNSASEFDTPFGGVFIESFDFFSPTLNPDNEDASEDFDRILGNFMPELGGSPIRGTEFPGGDRDDVIEEAIKLVGSVVGNTCTHEVGHSLGLAFFPQDRIRPGEQFHNKIPCDFCIMDSGSQRPFTERGEIDEGTPKFNDRNGSYLLEILPLP